MQDKQKVTLYLPSDLHRQLKIRAAVDSAAMSALAERAIDFYLANPEAVEQANSPNSVGQTHQIHSCPTCQTAVVLRNGVLSGLGGQPTVLGQSLEPLTLERVGAAIQVAHQDEEELVPC
jgi:plasmid stability protein